MYNSQYHMISSSGNKHLIWEKMFTNLESGIMNTQNKTCLKQVSLVSLADFSDEYHNI